MDARLDLLEGGLVQLEEDLERCADTGRLDLAPESAFIASYTVHDAGNIAEVILEFILEDLQPQ